MPWKKNVLVVANVTATSDQLVQELKARAKRQPMTYRLVVPATPFGGGRSAAEETLRQAVAQLREAGLEADGEVGAADPIVAVSDAWDPRQFDEIIVSTLPMKFSKWLHAGLPERIERLTNAPVAHIVSEPPKPEAETTAPPPHERRPLGPLSVLGWGAPKEEG